MSNWTDVASKALDFLQKPNGLGVVVILSLFVFLIYSIPLGVVTWTSWDNTNRLEKAITSLGDHCIHSLASGSNPSLKKQKTQTE